MGLKRGVRTALLCEAHAGRSERFYPRHATFYVAVRIFGVPELTLWNCFRPAPLPHPLSYPSC